MKVERLIISLVVFILACLPSDAQLASYVNTMIGTDGMGHTFPGACVPFGAVQLSPDTGNVPHNIDGVYQKGTYRYCAGYNYQDSTIIGFSHTHLSGTGHSDLGDILVMPGTGEPKLYPGEAGNPESGYSSAFSHDTEKSSPGYYEVVLSDDGIKAQLTATPRVGVHKYTFPKGEKAHIILDLAHGIYNYDGKVLWSTVRVENETIVTGYRITNGWARTNYTYFAISFSLPVREYGYQDREKIPYKGFWGRFNQCKNFPEMAGRGLAAYFKFDLDKAKTDELVVKVALSAVSTEGALKNLLAEADGKSFESLSVEAENMWNKELSAFAVEGTDDQKAMFYTSLYHTMINPSVYMDVDGKYRGLDHNIHEADGFTNYTIFSLWDTYRAEHPLLNIMHPDRSRDMVASMMKHWEQSVHGMLPVWSLMGNENWCMSGYHAVSVLADAMAKGVVEPSEDMLKAMTHTAKVPYYPGLESYMMSGYVPFDGNKTAASTTLEYAYDDWTIYQAAKLAGRNDIAKEFRSRALNYRNIYDMELGFARPQYSGGSFKEPFDVLQTHGEGFIEGNSWNFSFHVPFDVLALKELMGGEEEFVRKLDELFTMHLPQEYYTANEDITEDCLVGGYVHGNEPSHHVPYLYAWTSQPWKTQYWLREIMNKMYKNDIRGLGGNDDCGQMSAWYVFSAMGFYPVCPGTDQYVLGAPYMPYIRLDLPNGRTLEIKAPKVSDSNRYVKSLTVNGQRYDKLYVTHEDILEGGVWEFDMTSRPQKKRYADSDARPYSLTKGIEDDIPDQTWEDFEVAEICFTDKAPQTRGSEIYHSIISAPEDYIKKTAREVLAILYKSPSDSIVKVDSIMYSLEDSQTISAKRGSGSKIGIFYSTRHIEKSFAAKDTSKILFETRGVLLHELTHAYQHRPKGIGTYGTNKENWAFIEGMADAVRVAAGGFVGNKARPKGGHPLKGYRTTGYFLVWIRDNKDPDFLWKFNRSALELEKWSFDAAIKHVLGQEYSLDGLWGEYQTAMGDVE